MPADSKATSYIWLLEGTAGEFNAIVRFRWEPSGNEKIVSSMTFGTLYIEARDMLYAGLEDKKAEGWEPLGSAKPAEVPWVVAQNLARGQGFTIEIPKYDV